MSSVDQETVEFCKAFKVQEPFEVLNARRLVQFSRRYRKFCEEACNRPLSSHEENRKEELRQDIVNLVVSGLGRDDLFAKLDGDPRGFCVRVISYKMGDRAPYNTWGGPEDGYGIGEYAQ